MVFSRAVARMTSVQVIVKREDGIVGIAANKYGLAVVEASDVMETRLVCLLNDGNATVPISQFAPVTCRWFKISLDYLFTGFVYLSIDSFVS